MLPKQQSALAGKNRASAGKQQKVDAKPVQSYDCKQAIPKFSYHTVGRTIYFTNKSCGDYESVEWDFGDGQSSKELNPVHKYHKEGIYQFSLTACAANGEDKKFSGQVFIFQTAKKAQEVNRLPQQTCLVQPKSSVKIKKQQAYFTNKTIGEYERIRWDFGDGTFSLAENPVHTYPEAGTYYITQIAYNNGCEKSVSSTISIKKQKSLFFSRP